MPTPILMLTGLLAIAGGLHLSLSDSIIAGAWTTSCDQVLDNGLVYAYRATETFHADGSFESVGCFWTCLPDSGRLVTYGRSVDRGDWRISGGRLVKRYTSAQVEDFESALPQWGRADYQRELDQLIHQPFQYHPQLISKRRLGLVETDSGALYTMRRAL